MQLKLFPDLPEPVTKGIGGSEVAAVFGLSPWLSPLDLWKIKTDKPTTHLTSRAQRRGTRLEGLVRTTFERHAGLRLAPGQRGRHPRWSQGVRMTDATDATLPNGGLFEAKTTHIGSSRHQTFMAGHVPISYALQLQHYATTLRVDHGVIACLAGPEALMDWDVEQCAFTAIGFTRSAAIGALLEAAVLEFFADHIFPDLPPTWDRHPHADLLLHLLAHEPWLGPFAAEAPGRR